MDWEIDCSGSHVGQLTRCAVGPYVSKFFKKKGTDVFKHLIIKKYLVSLFFTLVIYVHTNGVKEHLRDKKTLTVW